MSCGENSTREECVGLSGLQGLSDGTDAFDGLRVQSTTPGAGRNGVLRGALPGIAAADVTSGVEVGLGVGGGSSLVSRSSTGSRHQSGDWWEEFGCRDLSSPT
jgi:hypothetical protein